MAGVDWLWILHPFLAVVLVYPLIGVVVRLAVQTRVRRLQNQKLPVTVGRDHSDLGRWLTVAAVVVVLIVLSVVIGTKAPIAQFEGGFSRAIQLLLVLCGTIVSLLALWQCKSPVLSWLFTHHLGWSAGAWRSTGGLAAFR